MMDFALKMMKFALKMMNFVLNSWGLGCGGGAKTPTEASGGAEYDVVQCAANIGQVTTACNHTVTGTWMPINKDGSGNNCQAGISGCRDNAGGVKGSKVYLAAMHHHCHAPTCLRIDFYNNDTGKLLCRVEPVFGAYTL